MPAAAVIPALKMHRIIAAVKKLVVGSVPTDWSIFGCVLVIVGFPAVLRLSASHGVQCPLLQVYFEQIRVL